MLNSLLIFRCSKAFLTGRREVVISNCLVVRNNEEINRLNYVHNKVVK